MADKTIIIGSDHGGYNLKKHLVERLSQQGYTVVDKGTDSGASCDYPPLARAVCQAVKETGAPGILICGTGIGMSMTANHVPGIRAALCTNEFHARMSREHNDANVLCLGERVTGLGVADAIVDIYLSTGFEGGRHQRRIDLIESD